MLHRYETTKEPDGSILIHDVPIFAEISRDMDMGEGGVTTINYDEEWINTAVTEAQRREKEQHHIPVLYVEHNKDGKPFREICGFFKNQRAHTIQYDGKPTRVVYADLVITLPEVFEEIKKGQFPGISVEIKESQENNPQTFTAAALLNSEPPALKFDPLLVKEPKDATERPKAFMEARKTGATYEIVCFSEFPKVAKFAEEKILDSEIGESREDMPQLKGKDFTQFLQHLKDEGTETKEGEVSASLLKPTQEELDQEKVKAIKETKGKQNPILVSSDNFILDGHHRWASQLPDGSIAIIRIEMPMEELLEKSKSFLGDGDFAEYQGKSVELNKPFRTPSGPKKFGVYVKNEKGNVIKLPFGDPDMEIKRDDPERKKSFRARHNCDDAGPKYKARYWSCKTWDKENVSDMMSESYNEDETPLTSSRIREIGTTGGCGYIAELLLEKYPNAKLYGTKKDGDWSHVAVKIGGRFYHFGSDDEKLVPISKDEMQDALDNCKMLRDFDMDDIKKVSDLLIEDIEQSSFAEYEDDSAFAKEHPEVYKLSEYLKRLDLHNAIQTFKVRYKTDELGARQKLLESEFLQKIMDRIDKVLNMYQMSAEELGEFIPRVNEIDEFIYKTRMESKAPKAKLEKRPETVSLLSTGITYNKDKKKFYTPNGVPKQVVDKQNNLYTYNPSRRVWETEDENLMSTPDSVVWGLFTNRFKGVRGDTVDVGNVQVRFAESESSDEQFSARKTPKRQEYEGQKERIISMLNARLEKGVNDYSKIEIEDYLKRLRGLGMTESQIRKESPLLDVYGAQHFAESDSLISRVNDFLKGVKTVNGRKYSGGFKSTQPPREEVKREEKEYDYHLPKEGEYRKLINAMKQKKFQGVKDFFNKIGVEQKDWRRWLHWYHQSSKPIATDDNLSVEDWDFLGVQPNDKTKKFDEEEALTKQAKLGDPSARKRLDAMKGRKTGVNLDREISKLIDEVYSLAMSDLYPPDYLESYEDKEWQRLKDEHGASTLDYDTREELKAENNFNVLLEKERLEEESEEVDSYAEEIAEYLENKEFQDAIRKLELVVDLESNYKNSRPWMKLKNKTEALASGDISEFDEIIETPTQDVDISAFKPGNLGVISKRIEEKEEAKNKPIREEYQRERQKAKADIESKTIKRGLTRQPASSVDLTWDDEEGRYIAPDGLPKYVQNKSNKIYQWTGTHWQAEDGEVSRAVSVAHNLDNGKLFPLGNERVFPSPSKLTFSEDYAEKLSSRKSEIIKELSDKLLKKENVARLVEQVDPRKNSSLAKVVNKLNDWFQDGTITGEYLASWLFSIPYHHIESILRVIGFSEDSIDIEQRLKNLMERRGETEEQFNDVIKTNCFAESKPVKSRRMLQTIVVSKEIAKDEKEAKKIAGRHGKTKEVIENEHSWRFRQRDPEEFDPDSYKTEKDEGVALVYANLKGDDFDEKSLSQMVQDAQGVSKTEVIPKETDVTVATKIKGIDDDGLGYEREKNNEFAKKIESEVKGKSEKPPEGIVDIDKSSSTITMNKGLPKMIKYDGKPYLYNPESGYWQNSDGFVMTKRGLASNLFNKSAVPIGDQFVATPKKMLFREYRDRKTNVKKLLEQYSLERDPERAEKILEQMKQEEGLRFAEETRAESYESGKNFLSRQRELEKEIEDLEWDLMALEHKASGTPVGKGSELDFELVDQLQDAREELKSKRQELASLRKGDMDFAEEKLNFDESFPDEVITREDGFIVMYKFNTEENGYQKKAIIDEEGNSLPLEEDEDSEAVFSIDMLIDPVPVPGTAYISERNDDQEDFGVKELIESVSPAGFYYYYIHKPMASLVGADPDSEWENEQRKHNLKFAEGEEDDEKVKRYEKMMRDRSIEKGKKDPIDLDIRDEETRIRDEGYSPSKRVVRVPNRILKSATPKEKDEIRKTIQDLYSSIDKWKKNPGVSEALHKLQGLGFSPIDLKAIHPKAIAYIQLNEGNFSEASEHLKEVLHNSERPEESLVKYYIKELVKEKEKEGLLPIQIDTELNKILGEKMDKYQDVIGIASRGEEFAEESEESLTKQAKMGDPVAKKKLDALKGRKTGVTVNEEILEITRKINKIQEDIENAETDDEQRALMNRLDNARIALKEKKKSLSSQFSESKKKDLLKLVKGVGPDNEDEVRSELKKHVEGLVQSKLSEGISPIQIEMEIGDILGEDNVDFFWDDLRSVYTKMFKNEEFAEYDVSHEIELNKRLIRELEESLHNTDESEEPRILRRIQELEDANKDLMAGISSEPETVQDEVAESIDEIITRMGILKNEGHPESKEKIIKLGEFLRELAIDKGLPWGSLVEQSPILNEYSFYARPSSIGRFDEAEDLPKSNDAKSLLDEINVALKENPSKELLQKKKELEDFLGLDKSQQFSEFLSKKKRIKTQEFADSQDPNRVTFDSEDKKIISDFIEAWEDKDYEALKTLGDKIKKSSLLKGYLQQKIKGFTWEKFDKKIVSDKDLKDTEGDIDDNDLPAGVKIEGKPYIFDHKKGAYVNHSGGYENTLGKSDIKNALKSGQGEKIGFTTIKDEASKRGALEDKILTPEEDKALKELVEAMNNRDNNKMRESFIALAKEEVTWNDIEKYAPGAKEAYKKLIESIKQKESAKQQQIDSYNPPK